MEVTSNLIPAESRQKEVKNKRRLNVHTKIIGCLLQAENTKNKCQGAFEKKYGTDSIISLYFLMDKLFVTSKSLALNITMLG